MKKEILISLSKTFEESAYEQDGVECWLARDLQVLLEYSEWRNFALVIDKAKISCKNAGQNVADHFVDINKMVELGSGAQREIDDIMLTRYASYHCASDQVSFVELIDVPTYGTSKLVLNDLKSTHIDRLLDWVQNGSAEFIFIPIGVARLLKRTSQFSWLPDRSMGHYKSLPILFRSDSKTVFSPYHFSCIGRGCLKKDRDLQIRDIGALIRNSTRNL